MLNCADKQGGMKMEYLAITALGEQQTAVINEITKTAFKYECNIVNCWVANLGHEFALNILFAGNWNEIVKLENQLHKLEEQFNLPILFKRTKSYQPLEQHLPYSAYIVTMDKPEVIYEVTQFFNESKIPINELYADVNIAKRTGAPILSISMNISVPSNMQISDLRERFFLFCDHFNLDGILEAEKG